MKARDVSAILGRVLEDYKIMQKDVAERSGVAATELSRYLKGEKDFNVETLLRIVGALPVDAAVNMLASIELKIVKEGVEKQREQSYRPPLVSDILEN